MPPAAWFLASLVVWGGSDGADGAIRHLEPGDELQATIWSAEPGDTIQLAPGVYLENLRIEIPVVLMGSPNTDDSSRSELPMIRGGYKTNVVDVAAPGTVLDGLQIAEAGPQLTKDMACVLVEADSVTVQGCRLTESLHGIYVKGARGIRLLDNRIEGRLDLIEADRGNGIHLWNSPENELRGNEILNVRDGIYFSFSDSTTVEENHIHHVRYGLHYMYSNHNRFSRNLFDRCVAGAALMYSRDILFEENVFASCRGFRAYGILYQSMDAVTARANLILDNSRGIFMNNSGSNRIENNDVVSNDLAIQLNGGCEENAFVGNNFIHNLSDLLLDVSDEGTAWTGATGGNFWSAYSGYDLDRNGIGDVAFDIQNVFQVLEARVPEARFYLFSPAAKILEIAETSLPILASGRARDAQPLMQPSSNDCVPYDAVPQLGGEPSRLWACGFAATSVIPFVLLMHLSRRKTGRQLRRVG